jgi:protein-L-isoaspartate(D-aspartate) O-methyltransferase
MGTGLADRRRRYAEMMTAALPGADPRIRDAFAAVPREKFLGPPPWTVRGASWPLTARRPEDLYHDVLVALNVETGVNNGSPSLHALMLHLLGVQAGQRVLHVGAGGGYYTAILAELVGPTGQVTAIEFDSSLAQAARKNLLPWPWATVVSGDGAAFPTATTDRVYVNFALADPADAWLDRLPIGGRLLFPLGAPHPEALGAERRHSARGAVLLVTRTPDGFAAAFDTRVAFVFAEGPTAGDAATRRAVYEALGRGGLETVKSLHRGPGPAGRTWLGTAHWSLGTEPP